MSKRRRTSGVASPATAHDSGSIAITAIDIAMDRVARIFNSFKKIHIVPVIYSKNFAS